MPTLRTVTVKSAGGDYSSLSSAEAGEQGDLVSLDRQLDIECYSMSDATAVTINGWTTDSTRYVRVYAPSSERHAGVWSTSKYRLEPSASFGKSLTINEDYVRIEGLQIRNQDANARGAISVGSTSAAASCDIRFDSIIVPASTAGTNNSNVNFDSGTVTLRNSSIYGAAGTTCDGIACGAGGGNVVAIDNSTVARNSGYGIRRVGGTVTLQNVYSGGNTTDDYNGTITRTACAHSSATSFSGSTASIAHSTANFTNVTAGSEDYHLVSGASSTLKTGGTDLSGTFTTDIDGETRSVPYSIGADQIVSAAAAGSCPLASRILSGSCFGGRGVMLCL